MAFTISNTSCRLPSAVIICLVSLVLARLSLFLLVAFLYNAVLLHRVDYARVYADVDAALLAEVTEYGLILGRSRVLLQCPDAAVEVISDIHVGVELHNSRCDHI